jgi:CheY-like chemotaxis protein
MDGLESVMIPSNLRLSAQAEDGSVPSAAAGAGSVASALKLQFLASLNHEIRTPLSGILGMADLLLETQLDEEQKDYVGAARDCAETLLELLNDTLEYTSLASGCVQVDEGEFHVEETLHAAIQENSARARFQGVELIHQPGEPLPPALVGDAYRIRQVVSLMIRHAMRSAGQEPVEIAAGMANSPEKEARLRITVRAPGGGQTAAQLRDVLANFDEIEGGATRRFNGLQLGLALMRRVLTLMGGDLEVEPTDNGAALLSAVIPMKVPRPVLVTRPHRESGPRDAGSRILIVEDNRISQQVLSAMLAKAAYRYDCAPDGPAAIEAAAGCAYDLILMDLQMPGMDGLEASDHIRKLPGYRDIPILALTAEVSDQVRLLCRQNGMAAFLNKPVQAPELLAMVERLLTA